jgi:peptide-methionine (S)-S-oxide reductase
VRTRVGYAGGSKANPRYHDMGDHTETFQLDYDPAQVSYAQLLARFWASHDPSERPYGRQYRCAVFAKDEAQRALAQQTGAAWAAQAHAPLRTAIEPLQSFTLAEDYHQKYYLRGHKPLMAELVPRYDEARFVASTVAARLNGYVGGGSPEALEAELPNLGLSTTAADYLRQRVARRDGFRCS